MACNNIEPSVYVDILDAISAMNRLTEARKQGIIPLSPETIGDFESAKTALSRQYNIPGVLLMTK
ncbi:MAG: hypothetical protein WC346_03995 [Methanogenium sp.]|jgi:hypothetical protein